MEWLTSCNPSSCRRARPPRRRGPTRRRHGGNGRTTRHSWVPQKGPQTPPCRAPNATGAAAPWLRNPSSAAGNNSGVRATLMVARHPPRSRPPAHTQCMGAGMARSKCECQAKMRIPSASAQSACGTGWSCCPKPRQRHIRVYCTTKERFRAACFPFLRSSPWPPKDKA